MNRLKQIAIRDILRRSYDELKELYDGMVGNGRMCSRCHARGMGSVTKHAPDCSGVRLMNDTQIAIQEMDATHEPDCDDH